ncbi:phytanoyl-CoA dioxygenase family protein [Streptomyces beihaiensis]|uniref:Phytanoyl-CoA dioxygenase family protein n=1 Tax=Streptomyces beihaiensis TaxID=2984495 RepID=A0ABT3TTE1_9ACTN|nr:phytanoyl-CoA dioxygenase family protein [Streptomyces beihaiensis]MCX3060305.1 phytanoyl-CoA dioxygenase family protein [Streptomyces beihaiensis]
MTSSVMDSAVPHDGEESATASASAREFARRGYTILRGLLDADEVEQARALCAAHLTGSGAQEMLTSDFLADDFLAGIVLRERVVNAVKELLGDERPVLYPNCTARKNVYVPWHVDATFVGPTAAYVWEPAFAHVQCGLYLQDNDPVGGGGIDVVRASHLMSFDGYGTTDPEFDIPARTVGQSDLRERVDTRAGDVVMWNARLMHTSTPVLRDPGREKFGVFFSYARTHARDNHRFLSQIAVDSMRTMNGVSRIIPRLAEISHMRYPESFPAWFAKEAAAAAVHIATL